MAPEVLQFKPYDGRADIWSLGITVIEMAEMHPPCFLELHPMEALREIPRRPPPKLKDSFMWSDEMNDFVENV